MKPLLLFCVVSIAPLVGQEPPAQPSALIANIMRDIGDNIDRQDPTILNRPFRNQVDILKPSQLVALYESAKASAPGAEEAVRKIQNNKTEQQSGSTAANSGSNSLAQKGAIAEILSVAVDNGGLQREISGTTVTFRGTPVGLLEAIKHYDLLNVLAAINDDDMKVFFNKFSFAVAFDTNRGGVQNTLLANSQQLQSWSVRFSAVNQRDATARRYAGLWKEVSDLNSSTVQNTTAALTTEFGSWKELVAWNAEMESVAEKFDNRLKPDKSNKQELLDEFLPQLTAQVGKLGNLKNPPPGFAEALIDAAKVWKSLDADAAKAMSYIQKGHLLTFDWTTKRDPQLPDLYSVAAIYEASLWRRSHDFTLNATADWYRVALQAPAGAGQFKSFNAVGQYDIPWGNFLGAGKFILSFAGKYQYVGQSLVNVTSVSASDPAVKSASSVISSSASPAINGLLPTIRGHLGAFQIKLSVPGGKSGVRIPIAFTAATRSEVFNRPDYRAHIGLSFDLDTLFARPSN